jgi:pseudomonalisin
MQTPRIHRFFVSLALLTAGICQMPLAAQATAASSPIAALRPIAQADRVAHSADFGPKTQLTGHIPDWVTAANQVASQPVDLTAPMHVTVVLHRDPAVEAAFTQLLADQQNPSSPLYHQWLKPRQVGQLFGLTDSDIAAVSGWLTAQGLTVSVEPNRTMLRVSGSTAAISAAFRISFAYFNAGDKPRLSTTVEPFIPAALTTVVNSIGGLSEIPLHPNSHAIIRRPSASAVAASAFAQPNLTTTENGSNVFFLTPKDFAVIYDINGVYTAGNTGATIGATAQHVAIMGQSRVAATDISEYATNVSLGSYNLNTIVPPASYGGVDPGVTNTGDQGEATLDVDRVIGTAPGAVADLLVSTEKSGGIDIGLDYNVNALLDPIQTVSFGACESAAGKANTQQDGQFFQQAAAEGITTFISSDDSGVNGCAAAFTPVTAGQTYTASINYLCSSSYVTCVGGTEFNDTGNPTLYWAAKNGTGMESALSYIPEGAWNEPTGNCNTGTYCPSASGGGASLYIAKPTWQSVTGVPSDGARDVPDVAFSAASHDGYYACLDYALIGAKGIPAGSNCTAAGGGYFSAFSGTSASAPGMAGIAALLNTKIGSAQGNLNPLLYAVYARTPSAFHDVTVTSSGVTGCAASTPSMCNNSTPGASTLTGGLAGFLVTPGYDEVTGLGSLDVGQFLTAAVASSPNSPSFTLAASPTILTFTSGATSGNTDTITVSSLNGFTGSVTFSACAISSSSAAFQPTCTISPSTVTVPASGTMPTAVVSVSSTVQTAALDRTFPLKTTFLALLLFIPALRRRRRILPLMLLFCGISAISGCSSNSSPASTTPKSSAGTYTVTLSATGTTSGSSIAASASTSFSLIIN